MKGKEKKKERKERKRKNLIMLVLSGFPFLAVLLSISVPQLSTPESFLYPEDGSEMFI
jgi:hypothetical protein